MCVCCFYTVFRDQLWKDVVNQSLVFGCTESRRDQEEGSELDSHEELDNHLRICGSRRDQEGGGGAGPSREPRRDQELGGGAGLGKLDNLLLQLFLNSCSTDIVLVTLFRTAVETAISEVHRGSPPP